MAKPHKVVSGTSVRKASGESTPPRKQTKCKISVAGAGRISALIDGPTKPKTCFVFAHGAGAGMNHSFMQAVADGLVERGIATLRYQFPYMEKGSKRPDSPAVAHATVRAAVVFAREHFPKTILIAGGKSFGGRMTSQAQALEPLEGVAGLAFLGFPLHPIGKPSTDRAAHLREIKVPMLFLQGTRDKLAELTLLQPLARELGRRVTLELFADADHSFHVPRRSGRDDVAVMKDLLDVFAIWAGSAKA
jgi:predicted alpha/beta-hydrolase family hydrolase